MSDDLEKQAIMKGMLTAVGGSDIAGLQEDYKKKEMQAIKEVRKSQEKAFESIEERVKEDPKKVVLELMESNKKLRTTVAEKTVEIRMLENQADLMAKKIAIISDVLRTEDSFNSVLSWQKYNKKIEDVKL